jgi:hypothetical protein
LNLQVARESLVDWGTRAKLLFIEGLRRESNTNLQIECAKGLMKFGPSGFRAILMSLVTKDEKAAKAIGEEMCKSYAVEDLLEWFSAYPKDFGSVQVMSEKLLTDLNFMSSDVEEFLKSVLSIGQQL